jgi:RNA-directed DNA polymerase
MQRSVRGWKAAYHDRTPRTRIVNYAVDFVIRCRATAVEVMDRVRGMISQLKLTVNETKTRETRERLVPEGTFDFLGYSFGRCYDRRTGRP